MVARSLRVDPTDGEYILRDPVIWEICERSMPGGVVGVLRCVILFSWLLVRDAWRQSARIAPADPVLPPAVLFFTTSRTELEALDPVAGSVSGSWTACAQIYGRVLTHGRFNAEFPLWIAHALAIPFLPLVLYRWATARGWRRATYSRYLHVYWMSYGFAPAAVWWLHRRRPAAVVIANDHNTHPHLLAQAADSLGIPTIYMQHACVTERFPPLTCDAALLDGDDAVRKYAAIGRSTTSVYVTGSAKLDAWHGRVNRNATAESIGIATNLRDPIARVDALCGELRARLPGIPIFFRPRPPGGRQEEWREIAQRHGLAWSSYTSETAAEFLARIDVLLAGDSSILLEAALLNVVPVYYDFSLQQHDWYGFVANGLAVYLAEPANAAERIAGWTAAKPSVRDRARLYCATVGTEYDGRSSALAGDVIQHLATAAPLKFPWRLTAPGSAGLAVYRIVEPVQPPGRPIVQRPP